MHRDTKILVLHSRTLLYILISFIALLLIVVILQCALSESSLESYDSEPSSTSSIRESSSLYIPGVYTSCLSLGGYHAEMVVYLDSDHINHIDLSYGDDAIATMYPFVQQTFAELTKQILQEQNLFQVNYTLENKYTSLLLLQSIQQSLSKAAYPTY